MIKKTTKKSASADWGPPSRVCACETLRSAPHRPLRSHIQSFGTLGQLLKFPTKKIKTSPKGPGGFPKLLVG